MEKRSIERPWLRRGGLPLTRSSADTGTYGSLALAKSVAVSPDSSNEHKVITVCYRFQTLAREDEKAGETVIASTSSCSNSPPPPPPQPQARHHVSGPRSDHLQLHPVYTNSQTWSPSMHNR
ncbi:uncharacterized protein SETTUDRAFT_25152 [Exserohilum turcica Et28A]|uniref:Uncharacterized protein n=1 Tax=Exserohilum turcicum (strain 28A) TaxID=671987 RepID=R0KTF3_EXST2|nr:uncharacterized protein SETTUDRAFT_25152 [Exserohilum turcica Et28A]EOA91057.1 hypothetical protein SETTUDRAFT_25152 [Exserohilum turcica Et28A]